MINALVIIHLDSFQILGWTPHQALFSSNNGGHRSASRLFVDVRGMHLALRQGAQYA
jgi:hypothetical protein